MSLPNHFHVLHITPDMYGVSWDKQVLHLPWVGPTLVTPLPKSMMTQLHTLIACNDTLEIK